MKLFDLLEHTPCKLFLKKTKKIKCLLSHNNAYNSLPNVLISLGVFFLEKIDTFKSGGVYAAFSITKIIILKFIL